MADKCPDEIIAEILSPALKVPEHLFADLSSKSPFAKYSSVPSSAALLVCKAWLRVATPLLYNVVVLRSRGQARALYDALRAKPELGRSIKRLRVEGGFAKIMQSILNYAPNITDLFLSLHLQSSDSTSGLIAGLSLINPTRLIITCAKWSNLNTIVFPYSNLPVARASFVLKICTVSTLKTVSFPASPISHDLTMHQLVQIAQSPSLEAIELRSPDKDSSDPPPAATDPRLKALLTWAYNPKRQRSLGTYKVTTRPPLDPTFRPLLGVPQTTADAVWSRILLFAMLGLPKDVAEADAREACTKRLPFLFVSKLFYRLALPHFYRLVDVYFTKLRSLADALATTPALGAHIRVLELRQLHSIQSLMNGPPDPGTSPADILRHTPHLRRLLGNGCAVLPWTALCALAESGGAKLEEVSGIIIKRTAGGVQSVTILARFTALRVLTWDTTRPGVMNRDLPIADLFDPAEAVPPEALPALEVFTIKSAGAFAPFAQMQLPNLRCVSVDTSRDNAPHNLARFLRAHGTKLWSLCVDGATVNNTDSVLVLCPNMSTLTCRVDSEGGYDLGDKSLAAGFQHAYLTTLILKKNARPHQNKLEEMSWTFFFRSRFPKAHERLPALRELRIMVFEWPTTEHNISKNFWVQTAEKLAAQGIKLTDSTGTEWHPRLKAKRASKS